jgi:hypothetical protein
MQHFGDSPSDRQVRAFLERLLESVTGKHRITPTNSQATGTVIRSIRRFRLATGTLRELVAFGFLSTLAADFLVACARAGKNIRERLPFTRYLGLCSAALALTKRVRSRRHTQQLCGGVRETRRRLRNDVRHSIERENDGTSRDPAKRS